MKSLWYLEIHIFPICSSIFLNLSAVFHNFPCGSFRHYLLSLCLSVSVIMFEFAILFKLFLFRCLHIIYIKCIPFLYVNSFFKVFSSVQPLSHVQLFATPLTATWQASLSINNSQSLLKLKSTESVMPSNHLILCCPLLLLPSIFPSIRVFSVSQFFTSGGQTIGVSASASVLPMNIQDWSPLGLTGWISLQSKGLSRVFSNTAVQKHQFFRAQLSLLSNSHIHTWPLEKP